VRPPVEGPFYPSKKRGQAEVKVALNEADFRDLVTGRVVNVKGVCDVQIALGEIGWSRMIHAIVDAAAERGIGVDHLIRLMSRPHPPKDDHDE